MTQTLQRLVRRPAEEAGQTLPLPGFHEQLHRYAQFSLLGEVHGLLVPGRALRLGHELHQVGIAVLARTLPVFVPCRVERLRFPAEPGQQLALQPGKVVRGRGGDRRTPVQVDAALHPFQRAFRFAGHQDRGQRDTVLRAETGLFGQRRVGRFIPLRQVNRAQHVAPSPARVFGLGACVLKARPDQLLECRAPGLVECLGGLLLNLIAEGVGVIVHPFQKPGGRLLRIGVGRLAGLDPAADQILGKLPEAAAGVVQFLGLLVAARKEGLAKAGRARWIGLHQRADFLLDRFQVANERVALTVENEFAGNQRQFDLPLQGVAFLTRFPHKALQSGPFRPLEQVHTARIPGRWRLGRRRARGETGLHEGLHPFRRGRHHVARVAALG